MRPLRPLERLYAPRLGTTDLAPSSAYSNRNLSEREPNRLYLNKLTMHYENASLNLKCYSKN